MRKTDETQIIGYQDATGVYHRPQPLVAYEEGGIYGADEDFSAWSPEALMALRDLMEFDYIPLADGSIAVKHPDFVVVKATSTFGKPDKRDPNFKF